MVRFKARHILCEAIYEDGRQRERQIKNVDLMSSLKAILKELHGDYGLSYTTRYTNMRVTYLNQSTNIILIRCKRGFHKMVQSCLPFVKKIGGEQAMLRTLHLGGTIRSCNKFLIKYHKAQLPKLLKECNNEEEKKKVQDLIAESGRECVEKLGLLEYSRTQTAK